MPVSQFAEVLQKIISFLPGTYGTSLMRTHALRGVFAEMESLNISDEVIKGLKDSIDCNAYFFDKNVSVSAMYLIISVSVVLLVGVYIVLNILKGKKK